MTTQDSTPISNPGRVLITGANGNLGQHLMRSLAGDLQLRAAVRSESARRQVEAATAILPEANRPEIVIVDYADEDAIADACSGCGAAVHLVGILKEDHRSRYETAHEQSCRALSAGAERAGLQRIVYLSIVGARPDSANACLASKGRAEQILQSGPVPTVVLRAPMVLGPGDAASKALRGMAQAPFLAMVGGGHTLHQPIDVRDVVASVRAAIHEPGLANESLDIGGPECLPHRALVARAAALYGKPPPRVVPIPQILVALFAAVAERISKQPPLTRAMLGVLQHDDSVDALASAKALGIELTPLDDTLRHSVGPDAETS